jgi:hypothetical protein
MGSNGTEGKKRDADVIVDAGYVRGITTGDIVVEDAMTFALGPPREKARPKTRLTQRMAQRAFRS